MAEIKKFCLPTGLDRMIFGSVTDRVLRLSPVPVFCIGPEEVRSPPQILRLAATTRRGS